MKLDAKKILEKFMLSNLNEGLPHLSGEISKLKFIHDTANGKMEFDMSNISDEAKIQIHDYLKKYSKD